MNQVVYGGKVWVFLTGFSG